METNFDKIPSELRELKQWVCWGEEKLPKNPMTGGNAQSNNPKTWGTYGQAIDGMKTHNFDGIGFMFANGYFGVDLDKCITDLDFVDEFADTLDSYIEYSKSAKGVHIICKGELPSGQRRKGNVEMYQSGRYFIMTGNIYGKEREIKDCTNSVKVLHDKYLNSRPIVKHQNVEVTRLELSDEDILDKAMHASNGSYFGALYRGDWRGGYTSQSEADLAFCNGLAFWCQRDFTQIDRIFRSSGLMRSKWDEKRSGATYGEKTINNSISSCTDVYSPQLQGKEQDLVVGVFGKIQKPRGKDYDRTDTGNANRFADKHRGEVKFSYQNKMWFYWDGKVWKEDLTGEVKKLADGIIADMRKQAFGKEEEEQTEMLKWASKTASSKGKTSMISESQHIDGIPVMTGEFDSHLDLLNCYSGIVNLRNGELIEHNSNYMLSKISTSEYNPKGGEPVLWMKFLDDVTGGDKELQRFLQKSIGYSLTGSVKEQCVFFLWGSGNNGKSTFLDIITDLAGSYSCNVQPETVMVKNAMQNSGANTDIARLKGARFVTTVEPNESVRINEGLLKQLTGGDKVTARHLYGREFEFTPEFKLWMATNHKPIIRGTDLGIWRRIRMIPFTIMIPPEKVDKNLKSKLRTELPLIFKWAVEGCKMWQSEGLELPDSVRITTEEYKAEMDILSVFLNDCVETNYLTKEKASEIYDSYSHWCDENNEFKLSSTKFSKEFVKRFPEKVRMSDGVYYKNCKITEIGKVHKHLGFGSFQNYKAGS